MLRALITCFALAGLVPDLLHAAPTYAPSTVELDVPAGGSASFTYRIDAPGAYAVAPYMWYHDQGLPSAWLGEVFAQWLWFVDSATQNVRVTVPPGTPAGSYRGKIEGFVMGGAHRFQRGEGVTVTVNVGSACGGLAEFDPASDNTFELWAPNHAMRGIELLGALRIPDGCSVLSAAWEVIDEYGQYSGSGELEITGDGSGYRAVPLLEVWREGRDKDGREYLVTLTVETEAGTATHTRTVTVLHDRRDKAGTGRQK